MGVKNLWDILDSCKQKLPLNHLQNKKVCVDLSCWLVQFCTANRSPAFVKDKVYLKNLFHRIRALLALNCSLIFVTDGAIPSIKLATYRRRLGSSSEANCDETSSQPLTSLRRNKSSEFSRMIKEAKHLGLALGIPCLDGVEEAEAQCALLNLTSVCEGCFTSDSDAFLFGARTVYRDVFIGDGGYVVCYEMEDIEKKLGFGRKSLISLALLLGCDYSNGVRGFGPEAACRLVKSAGDDSILDQILSDGVKATRKCKGKKVGINQNKAGDGDVCKKTNTSEVGMSQDSGGQFREVINAFLEPKCHSPDSEDVQRVCCQHPFRRSEFQQMCEKYFEWTPEKTDEYILPKIAERELRRFSNLRSTSSALGVKPMLNEIPVPCPVLAITKQRKVHGSEYYEVSWRNMYGLQTSVVPGDLIRSACPEKITEFLEKKDEEKKQKRKARPKKSAQQAEVKDVDARLQELLLGIESECAMFPPASSCPQTADGHAVVPGMDIVDLSSPSPPLRACKSQKFIGSTTATTSGIDLQCQSLLTDMTESQSSTQSGGAQNLESQSSTQSSDAQYLESQSSSQSSDALKFTLDDDLIDLSSPLPLVADRPCSLQDLPPCNKAERRALTDLSNLPEKSSMLGPSDDDRCKAGTGDGCVPVEASSPVVHGARVSSSRSNSLAESEADAIDLCSPSPAIVNRRRNVKLEKNVIDISEADSSVKSPEDDDHERKARELRLFLKSIRDEL
ncbi:single-strand DNA endonuclease 1-like [Lolium rigidum]|uniref:single-strand DNA endonuclease 1-like n=1 Tax=Lolium rigidum TaxID=89674 RepID=UPI001F5C365A|nr:single-strand DNA endonuclease 1-like [Lolium rigidum]